VWPKTFDRLGRTEIQAGMADAPLVIVTRPLPEAQSWALGLEASGVAVEVLPLIQIGPLADPSGIQAAWRRVPQHVAVMFVSANAVRFFMAQRPAGIDVATCRAWSTGPGTHAALLASGWPADHIDSPNPAAGQFDSEALWNLVGSGFQAGIPASVLIVRGENDGGEIAGRDWLAQQLDQAGVEVFQVSAYVRGAPVFSSAQQARALQAMTDGSWWLFSSTQAAQFLLQACPHLPLGHGQALATHPRIAERLIAQGWGCVHTVPAALNAQALSIKSLP